MKFVFISYNNYEESILNGTIDYNRNIGVKSLIYLFRNLSNSNHECISANSFLKLSPSERESFSIISEGVPGNLKRLIDLGCNPLIIFCFEVPFYYYKFYSSKIVQKFRFVLGYNQYLFQFSFQLKQFIKINFPSFEYKLLSDENTKPSNADKLDAICYIASNKSDNVFPLLSNKIGLIKLKLLIIFQTIFFKKFREIKKCNLINDKFGIINQISKTKKIHIYGRGWHNLTNLTARQQKLLSNNNIVFLGEVVSKHDILLKYKYSLIIENSYYYDILTEKIFDAILADSMPIFFGSMKIIELINKNKLSSLPMNNFDLKFEDFDFNQLYNYSYDNFIDIINLLIRDYEK